MRHLSNSSKLSFPSLSRSQRWKTRSICCEVMWIAALLVLYINDKFDFEMWHFFYLIWHNSILKCNIFSTRYDAIDFEILSWILPLSPSHHHSYQTVWRQSRSEKLSHEHEISENSCNHEMRENSFYHEVFHIFENEL